MITAEIIPSVKKTTEAAAALQEAGFRVLSIGESITIGGEQKLFEQFFGINLLKLSKDSFPGLQKPVEAEFYKPEKSPMIPDEFKLLIKDVFFPEPPEYFM